MHLEDEGRAQRGDEPWLDLAKTSKDKKGGKSGETDGASSGDFMLLQECYDSVSTITAMLRRCFF